MDGLSSALLAWFDNRAAETPHLAWRDQQRSVDPYRVWLSEIMLQQTQIATMLPYYERFLTAYPTVAALAVAPIDDVLKNWEGLGYYSRARNLHKAAQLVVTKHAGVFPTTAAELLTLPGVGPYTANAIASIAYGERVPVLDGNVIRVLTRLFDFAEPVEKNTSQRHLWAQAEALMREVIRPGDYNQAMMDLGREVCKPRTPNCAGCPVRGWCQAFENRTQTLRPVKTEKAPTPEYDLAGAVLRNEMNELLVGQRPADGLLGGLWEFPALRCEPGESPIEGLTRLLRDVLHIQATVGDELLQVKHAFSHFKIRLHVFECQHISGEVGAIPGKYAAMRWIALDQIGQLAFARADRKVITHLQTQRLF